MKSILNHYQDTTLDPRLSVLSFFFNARGAQLEKSISGLYRTLLFQLLRDSPDLFRLILPKLREKEDRQSFAWNDSELAETFHFLIRNDEKTSRLILVDALDECAKHEVRSVVDDFERSTQAANGRNVKLSVCLSSRHYLTITAKNATELHLEGRNTHDIHIYVQRELWIHEKQVSAEMENKLVEKASGVFLWVVLVIRQLRIASDRGDSLEETWDLIDWLPPELDNLFARIVATMDPRPKKIGLNIIHWVLGAMEPLWPIKLFLALKLADDQPPNSLVELSAEALPPGYDLDRFRRRLIESTCGLFELGKDYPHYIQYIHESVRDFLEGPVGLEAYGFGSKQELVRARNDTIFRSLQSYSQLKEIREAFKPAGSLPYANVQQLIDFIYGKKPRRFALDAGFFELYVAEYCLQHLRNFGHHDSIHSMPMCDRDTITLRRILESWIFAYRNCKEFDLRFTDELETLKDVIDMFKESCSSSTTCFSDSGELFRSMYNHRLLFLEFSSRYVRNHLSGSNMTYHLIFWEMADDARANIVKAAETIESGRLNQAESEQRLLSPQEACELCMEHAKDFKFVATVCTEAPDPWTMVQLASWSINESPDALRLLMGCECAAGGEKAQPTAGYLDTGPDLDDIPRVFLLLRQKELAETCASNESSLEVVGIFEHHTDFDEGIYSRYRDQVQSWHPRATSRAKCIDSENEGEDTSDAERR